MAISDDGRVTPAVPDRVFITGANGFIGRALAARLRDLGSDVRGVDLRPDPANGVLEGSTTDPASWEAELEGVDAVIHTAAIVSHAASYRDSWTVNALGTSRVVQAAAAAGVPRFVHFSSILAYGFDYPPDVDEDYPVRVSGHTYPDTKVNSEAVVMAAHAAGKIDVTVVRPGDVYGPGSVWVREPLKMLKARQMILPAGGKGIFTQVYLDNLVDGVLLALTNPAASGQVFTLTDGDDLTCKEYFGRLASMAGGSVSTLPTSVAVPVARATGTLMRLLGQHSELTDATMLHLARKNSYSIEKARDVLGYQPRVNFDDGMEAVEAWAQLEGII